MGKLLPRVDKEEFEVRYLNLSTFAHATEDAEKVKDALRSLLPEEIRDKVIIKTEKVKGFYGNPISIFRINVRKKQLPEKILEYLVQKMDERKKINLGKVIEMHVDNSCSLYLRFNKQKAYQGKIQMDLTDPIRCEIKFKVFPPKKSSVIEACEKLGLIQKEVNATEN